MAKKAKRSKGRDVRMFALKSQLEELKISHERELRSIKAELSEAQAQNSAVLERLDEQDKELNAYAHALRKRRAPKSIKKRRAKGGATQSTLVVLASDWHIEEIVEAKTLADRGNAYSPEIARARAERFFRKTVDLAEMCRKHTRVDDCVLALLGDFITGHIHAELAETTAMAPLEAIDFAGDLLRAGITYLIDHGGFKRIIIPCCFGNHGRLTPKPYYGKAAVQNLEWFMYSNLKRHFEGAPVEFVVTESRYNEDVEVYGRRLRFHHGEDLKYAGGLQGFYGRLYKLHLEKNQHRACYWTCVGHWHRAHTFRRIGMVNGSLIGDSPYGERFGSEKPMQVFGLIEADRGCTLTGPVFVED